MQKVAKTRKPNTNEGPMTESKSNAALPYVQGLPEQLDPVDPNNINRDSGIEIPEAWMPMIKKNNNRRVTKKRAAEGVANRNREDRNLPITAVENQPITEEHHAL